MTRTGLHGPVIRLKRAYAAVSADDGCRVLVDRLWPRGLAREKLQLDLWLGEIAPSSTLRHWYHHETDQWPEFKRRYFAELAGRQEELAALLARVRGGPVTLVYAARDESRNNAVALKEYLETLLAAGSGNAASQQP